MVIFSNIELLDKKSKDSMTHSTTDSQTLLNQIVLEFMRDQKRKRRLRWLYRFIFLIGVLCFAYFTFHDLAEEATLRKKDHVGLIDIVGEIAEEGAANADDFAKGLDAAYKNTGLKAMILRINSPGGSPVQADYMYNQIVYYRNKYPNIPIYAVCEDMCASAAYYVAAAASDISANPSSLIGSIGVIYNGFGFTDVLQKVGVTRRLYTAGTQKGFLDPFSPVNEQQVQYLKTMLNIVHQTFIDRVKAGRGNKLKLNYPELFSGLFWTGIQAKELGLIDHFASAGEIARHTVKLHHIIDYSVKKSVFERMAKGMHEMILDSGAWSKAYQPIKPLG